MMNSTERKLWADLSSGEKFFADNAPGYEVVKAMSEVVAKLDRRLATASKLNLEARKVMQSGGEASLFVPTGFTSIDGDMRMTVSYGMIEVPAVTAGLSRCEVMRFTLADAQETIDPPMSVSLIGLTDSKIRRIVIENPDERSFLGRLVNGLVYHESMRLPIGGNRFVRELAKQRGSELKLTRMVFCLNRSSMMFSFESDDTLAQSDLTPAVAGVGIYGEGVFRVREEYGLRTTYPVDIFLGMVGQNGVMSAIDERGKLMGNGMGILGQFSDKQFADNGLLGEVDRLFSLFDSAMERQLALLQKNLL